MTAETAREDTSVQADSRPGSDGTADPLAAARDRLEQAVRRLSAELDFKTRLVGTLTNHFEETAKARDAERDGLAARLAEEQLRSSALDAELRTLRGSRSYRLARVLGAVPRFCLPPGSVQRRLVRGPVRAVRLWRHKGIAAVARRIIDKVVTRLHADGTVSAPDALPEHAPGAVPQPHSQAEPSATAPAILPTSSEPETASWVPSHADLDAYDAWMRQYEPSANDLEAQRQHAFDYAPTVSIIVPTCDTQAEFLISMLDSVVAQTYENWELCIADASRPGCISRVLLEAYASRDWRLKIRWLAENRGIAANSNEALLAASGDFVAFLDHDDTLAPSALFEVVRAANRWPDADLLYSDEDKLDETGARRSDPHFKPDWSPDTLRSHNYLCHLSVARRELLAQTGIFREGFDGSQDYDLVLRASEQARRIVHLPHVLYHWRMHASSIAADGLAKPYAYDAARRALREHLARRGDVAEVSDGKLLGVYDVHYALSRKPLVSVIIPNRNHPQVLERCLRSLAASRYALFEVLVVENGSSDSWTFDLYRRCRRWLPPLRVLNWDHPFNYSAVNNFAVSRAAGEVILLLNNDVEAINPDWMERMLEQAMRPQVGAVGAKLYYPDGTIQHGGVILGVLGIAGHAHQWMPGWYGGYFHRLAAVQNLSAVTAACLMTRREVYEEVGGFDEGLSIAFNDVDFCVRLRRRGYRVIWTPFAELTHHESLTRGKDDTPEKQARSSAEVTRFAARWADVLLAGDPYYSRHLSLMSNDFTIRRPDEPAGNPLVGAFTPPDDVWPRSSERAA